MARQGRIFTWWNINRAAAAGLALALLGLYQSPARAQGEAPPEAMAAIAGAARQADAKAMSAAVIDAIAANPQAVEAIVSAAARAAPAYSLSISLDVSRAYPGYAERIAAALTRITPEMGRTVARVAEITASGSGGTAGPVPTAGESGWNRRRGLLADFKIELALGAALRPKYEGDDKYDLTALPVIDVTWRERIFIAWRDTFGEQYRRGLGVNAYKTRSLRAGPFLTYDPGRQESEADRLAGTGDVDGTFEAGVFAEWVSRSLKFSIDYKQAFASDKGHDGSLWTFAGAYGGRLNERFGVSVSAWGTYASENYLISYFGVSAAQAASSVHSQFNPAAGFKDVGGDVTFRIDWSEDWYSLMIAQWKVLLGDAALSPLIDVDSDNQLFFGGTIGYKF